MMRKVKIKVKGHLDKKWKNWFEEMEISYEKDNTILSGIIRDETHLHGILNHIRDLIAKAIIATKAKLYGFFIQLIIFSFLFSRIFSSSIINIINNCFYKFLCTYFLFDKSSTASNTSCAEILFTNSLSN